MNGPNRLPNVDKSHPEQTGKLLLLSEFDIFCDLTADEVKEIGGMISMTTASKGHIFYRPEEQAEVLFLLKAGKVNVYTINADGKRLLIETIGPGTFFGEMSLTAQHMHRAYAEAAEDSLICVLSRGDLERLLLRKPQIAIRLLNAIGSRLEEARAKLEETTFHNAKARVCRTVIRLTRGSNELFGMTHQELADAAGLSRETVTNILGHLQTGGILELGTKRIAVIDRAGLELAAEI